ncbi:hypothetical protein [Bacillus thuringiensis]|uniref:hypothetical protein n=1 Tax=Bacillus thuringiensis TaxID=1428 RepID=UPI0021D6983A|nr:hypothetical protein [Bacillus thuringiensis]MCU7667878.1 hypothetical protein [Bacillus thuringiensis]
MSKRLTFLKKIQLVLLYINHQKGGVIVTCAYCRSTNLTFEKQRRINHDYNIVYKSSYRCADCGAFCENKQDWIQSS